MVKSNTEDSEKVKDTVISQDPLNSVEVPVGTTVTITISSGVSPESKKEKEIPISVLLPTNVDYVVAIKSFVDKQLVDSVSIIPSDAKKYEFTITGTKGTKSVTVTINGAIYRKYSVNFDTGNVDVVEERNFSPSSSSSQQPSSSSPSSQSSQPSQSSNTVSRGSDRLE